MGSIMARVLVVDDSSALLRDISSCIQLYVVAVSE